MCDLLAVVLLVFTNERSLSIHACEPYYLLHDVYAFFTRLLQEIWSLFEEKKLIERCTVIYDRYLMCVDRQLYEHLAGNDIAPEVHLTRWLRCMLTREFQLDDLLKVWDFIMTAAPDNLDLCCVAMITL
jgi:hypothetical protein